MEEWQIRHVWRNLSKLITTTTCGDLFLAELTTHLSQDDQSVLAAKLKSDGCLAQAKLLYDIGIKKTGMYEIFTKALFETNQTGAFQIFAIGFIEQRVDQFLGICGINEQDSRLWASLKGLEELSLQCIITFQSHEIPLKQILNEVKKDIVDKHIQGKLLIDLINNNRPVIVQNFVPKPLNYYITRRMTSRNHLNAAVLKGMNNDIFVVKGIEQYELRTLTESQMTDISGNQIENITCRFIVLEYEQDFYKICKLATTSVHLLDYQNGHFIWKQTHGNISILQEYVHETQDEFNEKDFSEHCLESLFPICISDTPGMGKTLLLASIANSIMITRPRKLVLFFVLREFVPEFQVRSKGKVNKVVLIDLISEKASNSEFGKEIVKGMLNSHTQKVELMFDGFDEVLPNQVKTAKVIFRTAIQLKSARIYVTTRPHLRTELEKALRVFGYNILPFREHEQIQFLMQYWEQKGANYNEGLQQFSSKCLTTLQDSMNDFEQHFAGIPLQCRLLAEVYEEDAIKYSKPEIRVAQSDTDINIRITSIFEIYRRLMELRFERAIRHLQNRVKLLLDAHMYASLLLLFPENAPHFESRLKGAFELDATELFSVGILEMGDVEDTMPRFVHRTFAEYFVAQFLVDMLVNHQGIIWSATYNRSKFRNLFFNKVLRTTKSNEQLLTSIKTTNLKPIESFSFQYPVICYFINAHLHHVSTDNANRPAWSVDSDILYDGLTNKDAWTIDSESLFNVLSASASQNYAALYLKAAEVEAHKPLILDDITRLPKLLLLSVKHSNLELVRMVYRQLVAYMPDATCYVLSSFPEFKITPLHVAVEMGNYAVTEFLFDDTNDFSQLSYLIHCCVSRSMRNSDSVIFQKTQILRLFARIYPHWLNEPLEDGSTPLLQLKVHEKLVACLIELGADLNVFNKQGSFLHKLAENGSCHPQTYHRIVLLALKHGYRNFDIVDESKRELLHTALHNMELAEETIELFHMMKANFNAIDRNGDSILFYAIKAKRSVSLLKSLVYFGSDVGHINSSKENVLHVCAKYGTSQAFDFFLNSQDIGEKEIMAENINRLNSFSLGLQFGSSMSVRIIMSMENKGLQISKDIASLALKTLFCNKQIKAWEIGKDFVEVTQYLMDKGGTLSSRHGKSPWELEVTNTNLQDIAQAIVCSEDLLKELRRVQISGIETHSDETRYQYSANLMSELDVINVNNNKSKVNRSKLLIDALKSSNQNTFERLCVSLLCCRQIKPFLLLKQCLQSDNQDFAMFLTPCGGLLEFIHSKGNTLIVLLSFDVELSIRRIKDMIDPDVYIMDEKEIKEGVPTSNLVIYPCKIATSKIVQNLVLINRKTICICTNVETGIENCAVLEDEVRWEDLASDYRNELISFEKIGYRDDNTSTVAEFSSYTNESLVDFIYENLPEYISPQVQENTDYPYLSNSIFHYFLPDKVVFHLIKTYELQEFIRYGHNIGDLGDSLLDFDYMVVKNEEQFDEISKDTTFNVHLVKYEESGRLKLVKTKGSDEEIKKFIEKTPQKLSCEDFPFCTCGKHPIGSGNLIWNVFQFPKKQATYWINVLDIIKVTKINFSLGDLGAIAELASMFTSVYDDVSGFKSIQLIRQGVHGVHLNTDVIHPMDVITSLLQHLQYDNSDRQSLQQLAVKMLFSHLARKAKTNNLDKYVQFGVLECKNGNLEFVHEHLVWYFIADLVVRENEVTFADVSQLKNELFRDCIEVHNFSISHSWWNNTNYSSEPIYSFKFAKKSLFQYLEAHLCRYPGGLVIAYLENQNLSIEFGTKWIHACVFGNCYNLLKLGDQKLFNSKELVLLAVNYSEVAIVNLVITYYTQQSKKPVSDITFKFKRSEDVNEDIYNILHVAALRGNYSVMDCLLNKHNFKGALSSDELWGVLLDCLPDTRVFGKQIGERKRIITSFYKLHPRYIQENASDGTTLLFNPYIHIDLVLFLINLGVDMHAADKDLDNVLNLYPRFMTPQDYDKLVRKLDRKGDSKIFHSRNRWQETALHTAVWYLDVLDSTIELLSSANVDFTAVNEDNNTVLCVAVIAKRSLRLLDSLISAGADIHQRVRLNATVLHVAAKEGNITALRYLIIHGSDVNATDKDNTTPLQLALKFSKTHTHEIVQTLLKSGAKVNARNRFKETALSIALTRKEEGKIEARTVELLITAGAELSDSVNKFM